MKIRRVRFAVHGVCSNQAENRHSKNFLRKLQKGVDKSSGLCYNNKVAGKQRQDVRIWRNWQTRMVQVHVIAISWRFKSSYPHPKPSYSCMRVSDADKRT